MKKTNLRLIRTAGLAGALSAGVFTSCSLPQGMTWNDVRTRGLIPVLMAGQPSGTISQQGPDDPVRVREIVRPEIANAPYARPVLERAGYVYSPFLSPERVVDVRSFGTGEEVRCPYTMKAFLVPDFSPVIAQRETPARPRPVTEVVSNSRDSITMADLNQQEEPKTISPTPEETVTDLPYGMRVDGRPGFVYSPYAARNQLVDVAGIAPGVEVKCPYSGRLFRVPEPTPEEAVTPPGAPTETPPAVTENTAPAPLVTPSIKDTETPAPSPSLSSPSPAPRVTDEPMPTAKWTQKDRGLVQSPFGNEGQLVDVTGKAAGARVVCPFTGKTFLVPSAE